MTRLFSWVLVVTFVFASFFIGHADEEDAVKSITFLNWSKVDNDNPETRNSRLRFVCGEAAGGTGDFLTVWPSETNDWFGTAETCYLDMEGNPDAMYYYLSEYPRLHAHKSNILFKFDAEGNFDNLHGYSVSDHRHTYYGMDVAAFGEELLNCKDYYITVYWIPANGDFAQAQPLDSDYPHRGMYQYSDGYYFASGSCGPPDPPSDNVCP